MSAPVLARRFLLAVLLGLSFGPPRLLAQPEPGRKIAVLVGIKAYHHADLPDLEYTERDVEELARVLEPAGYQVTLLTTSARDEKLQPTLANIRQALEAALKGVTKRDTILVALAGHGLQPDGSKESYFCPLDARPRDPKTLLSLPGLVNQLADSGVGVKLLLVDACRNDPEAGRGVDGSRVESLPKGVAALFSCSPGQRAFETKKAGGGHGVFFHFVLEGLRGGARNGRGEVTWNSLADYVQENVEARVPEWIGGEARQDPNEVKNLSGRSPVLLVTGPMRRERTLSGSADNAPRPGNDLRKAERPTVGLEITEVSPGSPAARAGLEPDDIILEVDHQAVSNLDGWLSALKDPREHTLLYWKSQQQAIRQITLTKEPEARVGITVHPVNDPRKK